VGRSEFVMKVLVTAASKYGATGEIARAIGDVLDERGLDATVSPTDQVDRIDHYDAVVLGSAVYAGHWMKAAKELVERAGGAMAKKPVWLFSSGPIGDPPKPEEDPVDVAQIVKDTKAREQRVFAGKLVKKQLSFPEGDRARAPSPRRRLPRLDRDQELGGRDRGRPVARSLTIPCSGLSAQLLLSGREGERPACLGPVVPRAPARPSRTLKGERRNR
jgi:menaquinone-dependent protoporphyrinogen oxidase